MPNEIQYNTIPYNIGAKLENNHYPNACQCRCVFFKDPVTGF